MELTLSLAQIDIQLGKPGDNFTRAADLVKEAASQGCDVILFPELWSTGYDLTRAGQLADGLGEGMFEQVAKLARQENIWIGGSLLEKRSGQTYNTFTLYNPLGELSAVYRKIHLFRLMDEDRWLAPGDQVEMVSLPWGGSRAAVALAVCYDLRFPEIFRNYAVQGASICLICAEWPSPRISHWQTLLRARAIENQMFVAGVNRVGTSGTDHFGGCSAVIGPWGETIAEAGDQESLVVCEVRLEDVEAARTKIPVFKDRRPEVYSRPVVIDQPSANSSD